MRIELALICAALAACTGPAPDKRFPAPEGAEIRALPGGAPLTFRDLAARVAAADLVIVGEYHDDPAHQAMQAALIGAVRPGAAAFEMVPRTAEGALADLRAAKPPDDAQRAAAQWDRYAPWHGPIAALAPGAPALGAGVARADLRAAMTGSAAAVLGDQAAALGVDAPLAPDVQSAMEDEQIAAHCHAMPASMAPGMVEAQRLRDAAFAAALLRADHAAGAAPALLITGNGHARRDRGSPAYLGGRDVLVIGQANRVAGGDWRDALAPWQTPGVPAFDILVLTDPPPGRGDPCDAFRKGGKS